jgi:glycosyltransferase involved in cell wall biosynthesis
LTTDLQNDKDNAKKLAGYCHCINLFKTRDSPDAKLPYKYPMLMRKYYSDHAIRQISKVLGEQKFDIVHIEGYYLMQLVPDGLNTNFHFLLVEHNMEYMLSLQRMLLSSSIQEAQLYWQEYCQTLYWERLCWRRANKIITLTPEDTDCIKRLEPNVDVEFIPNGTDHDFEIDHFNEIQLTNNSTHQAHSEGGINYNSTPSILFVGNFLYYPNIDAILFFCKDIFPLILKEIHNAVLLIVGNSPSPEIKALEAQHKGHVVVTGYVSSLYHFYNSAKVVVCPLRIGGGIKVKIIEALRAGKAIVSTSVGVQGIDINKGLLYVSDRISDFATNVSRLLSDQELRHNQELNALKFMKSMPRWTDVEKAYVRCYTEMS